MIVPDLGVGAEDEAMVALKKDIESSGDHVVKIFDLPAIVRSEHEGEELTESKVIELAARKLEQLASYSDLVWDVSDNVETRNEHQEEDEEEEKFYLCRIGNELKVVDEYEYMELMREFSGSIDIESNDCECGELSDDYECGEPNAVIVFGKSAMLAGGLGRKDILFIDPEYDSEWPWKKQYYADQKLSGQYYRDKYEYERSYMETVTCCGIERTRPWKYSRRYGLVTNEGDFSEFWDHYPRMAEVNRELKDNITGLAGFICEFADNDMSFPLENVYEAIRNLQGRDIRNFNEICNFAEPVKLDDITVLGIRFGAPMANGQSCYKLKVVECKGPLPLEGVITRRDLNKLRAAIVRAGATDRNLEPERKRILIVPDYFTPYDAPIVRDLYNRLKGMGYYVAVYVHGDTLEKSRQGIERRCKVKPFDLIVTLETGCLLATRITNCPRILVNPDWNTWEDMKRLLGNQTQLAKCRGEDHSGPFFTYYLNRDEVEMARQMAERANIKRGRDLIYGWFSTDADPELSEEHMKRFNNALHIPHFKITTGDGEVLARQIHNILILEDHHE